jgi:hypothetical protein
MRHGITQAEGVVRRVEHGAPKAWLGIEIASVEMIVRVC